MSTLLKHVEWLLNNRIGELKAFLDREKINIGPEQALMIMHDADPSERKLAVQWIFDGLLSQAFRWEDIEGGDSSKVYLTLKSFGENRMKLNGLARSLSHYAKLSEVYNSIKQWVDEKEHKDISGKDIKRQEKQEVLDESLIVYRSDSLIVSVPQTARAAKWWGKGTQWCTAADKNNYFDHYNKTAPLIIFTFTRGLKEKQPTGELVQKKGASRLQLWAVESSIQFMDESDSEIDYEFIKENYNEISGILEWIFLSDQTSFDDVVYGLDYSYGKEITNLFTPEQLFDISKKKPNIIKLCSNKPISNKDCKRLFDENRLVASLVPKDMWSRELAEKMIKDNIYNINFIPTEIFNLEFCNKILTDMPENDQTEFFEKIFEENIDNKLWLKLATINRKAFTAYLPYFQGTAQELNLLVRNRKGIKKSVKDNDWFKMIVAGETSFKWIPYKERTKELCDYFLANNLATLSLIPEALKTPEMCKMALEQGLGNIWEIPIQFRTEEIYLLSIEKLGFGSVENRYYTRSLFEQAISNRIDRIKSQLKDFEQNSHRTDRYDECGRISVLHDIPPVLIETLPLDSKRLDEIIKICPSDIESIPKDQQTRAMLICALKNISHQPSINRELLDEQAFVEICKVNRNHIDWAEIFYPDFRQNHGLEFYWKPEYFTDLTRILSRDFSTTTLTIEDNFENPPAFNGGSKN